MFVCYNYFFSVSAAFCYFLFSFCSLEKQKERNDEDDTGLACVSKLSVCVKRPIGHAWLEEKSTKRICSLQNKGGKSHMPRPATTTTAEQNVLWFVTS